MSTSNLFIKICCCFFNFFFILMFSVLLFLLMHILLTANHNSEKRPRVVFCFFNLKFPGDLGTIKCHHHFLAAYLFCLGFFVFFESRVKLEWAIDLHAQTAACSVSDWQYHSTWNTVACYFFQLLSPLTPKNYLLQYCLVMCQTEVLNTRLFFLTALLKTQNSISFFQTLLQTSGQLPDFWYLTEDFWATFCL